MNDLPPVGNPVIEIKIWATNAPVAIGEASLGRLFEIGLTQYGASAGIIDYSKKETDEFGNTTFVKRAFSKRADAQVFVRSQDINRVQRTLYDSRAQPLMWIFSDQAQYDEPLVIYGFYRDFTNQIAYPSYSLLSIQIEGLI
jgi:hypothetical protein